MDNYKNAKTKIDWHSKAKNRKIEYKALLDKFPADTNAVCYLLHQPFNIPLEIDEEHLIKANFEKIVKIAIYIGLFVGISHTVKNVKDEILDNYQYHIFSNIYHYVSDKELDKLKINDDYSIKFQKEFNKLAKQLK